MDFVKIFVKKITRNFIRKSSEKIERKAQQKFEENHRKVLDKIIAEYTDF